MQSGDLSRGIPACTACHSLYGEGNIQAGFPKISGQQKGYLISTLKEYRSKAEMQEICFGDEAESAGKR